MKLFIDKTRCTGHGRCFDVAPELFDADDAGRGVVRAAEVSPELEGRARQAVASCPEGAVVLDVD